jgi:hypothetical protein
MKPKAVRASLRQQVLLAALDCSKGDLHSTFTAEELLLAAWKRDPMAWGLRGHEEQFPDSEKIYKELDRVSIGGRNVRGGLAALGLLEKVHQRTFRLTPSGLAEASEIVGAEPSMRGKAERSLADAIQKILSHPVYQEWKRDESMPKHFRDAGHFWGVAVGTPPSVIQRRVSEIDHTLEKARSMLNQSSSDEVASRHGHVLFSRDDIQQASEFQTMLKTRFGKDLATLQANIS